MSDLRVGESAGVVRPIAEGDGEMAPGGEVAHRDAVMVWPVPAVTVMMSAARSKGGKTRVSAVAPTKCESKTSSGATTKIT